MMESREVHFWGPALARWPDDVVSQMKITGANGRYLREVGLPTGIEWNLEIHVPSSDATSGNHDCVALAYDGCVPICVVPHDGDEVVALEDGSRRLVNANVPAFGAFLMLYHEYRTRVRDLDEDDALTLIAEIDERMRSADPLAMAGPENYWPLIVEQMRDGLL